MKKQLFFMAVVLLVQSTLIQAGLTLPGYPDTLIPGNYTDDCNGCTVLSTQKGYLLSCKTCRENCQLCSGNSFIKDVSIPFTEDDIRLMTTGLERINYKRGKYFGGNLVLEKFLAIPGHPDTPIPGNYFEPGKCSECSLQGNTLECESCTKTEQNTRSNSWQSFKYKGSAYIDLTPQDIQGLYNKTMQLNYDDEEFVIVPTE